MGEGSRRAARLGPLRGGPQLHAGRIGKGKPPDDKMDAVPPNGGRLGELSASDEERRSATERLHVAMNPADLPAHGTGGHRR